MIWQSLIPLRGMVLVLSLQIQIQLPHSLFGQILHRLLILIVPLSCRLFQVGARFEPPLLQRGTVVLRSVLLTNRCST